MRKTIIGVMGAGNEATEIDKKRAYEVGKLIAKKGWVLLSGGRNKGVMDEVNRGARDNDGLTIGIIPGSDNSHTSKFVDVPIITGMGSARNTINVLSSDVVIAIGIGAGTASEIALALKAKKQVILLNDDEESKVFFKKLGGQLIQIANDPQEAIEISSHIIAI